MANMNLPHDRAVQPLFWMLPNRDWSNDGFGTSSDAELTFFMTLGYGVREYRWNGTEFVESSCVPPDPTPPYFYDVG